MTSRKPIDSGKLVEAVEAGRPTREILAKFEIKSSNQLKGYYVDALMELGRAPEIVMSRRQGRERDAADSRELSVNKRGSLIVHREVIESMGFEIGDTFSVRKTAAGISLKKK